MTPHQVYSPPALHFLVIDLAYSCGTHLCTFTCTTDVPCHLFAHVSAEKPIIRRIPYQKRGANFELSSVTCFVEVDTVEQDEAGDTTSHTFPIPFPIYDHTYYWYLTGTQGGIACKSISQIFSHACSEPLGPFILCTNSSTPPWAGFNNNLCYNRSMAFRPTQSMRVTKLAVWIRTRPGYQSIQYVQIQFWTSNSAAKPITQIPGGGVIYVYPIPTTLTKIVLDLPTPAVLTANTNYAWAIMALRPPWVYNAYHYIGLDNTDTCPHPYYYNKRIYTQSCSRGRWLSCLCTGKAWYNFVSYGMAYEFTGFPL